LKGERSKLWVVRRLVTLIVVGLLCSSAEAYVWEFVEVELSLRPDGKATVVYKVAIRPTGRALHGFYFEGYTGKCHFDRKRCYAVDARSRRYELEIKKVAGRKLDVLLAGGAAVRAGRVIYVLTFGTDLGASGHLERTTSTQHGKLTVLHWAPVQWDAPLGHYTLTIHWPIEVGTDGIWEAANPAGELFGKDRLRWVLVEHAEESAAEIHAAVVAAVNAFRAAAPQKDDMTLVAIKAL